MIGGIVSSGACVGCGACFNVCPKGAITMAENEWGEVVPQVASDLCAYCSTCLRACPRHEVQQGAVPIACYAAWAADSADSEGSSSGGIGFLLARAAIERGAAVCGCVMDGPFSAKHVVATTMDELDAIRGSKYIQSDTNTVYAQVKQLLAEGREVLFTGAPCHIAALKGVLHGDPEGLTTADLVCHGIPPVRYLREYVEGMAQGAQVAGVSFRDSQTVRLGITTADGTMIYAKPAREDAYLAPFLKGVIFREGCYTCPYAAPERVSDVTIGDFWGLDRSTLRMQPPKAVSVVTVNTSKGARMMEELGSAVVMEERDYEEAKAGNYQLRRAYQKNKFRAPFRDAIAHEAYPEAIRECGMVDEIEAGRVNICAAGPRPEEIIEE